MAALNRPTVANYVTQENYQVGKARDFDDHTFNGIMFNVKCRTLLPVHSLIVRSVAVRGDLGEMRVFVTKGGYQGKHLSPDMWQLVHHERHESSMATLVDLPFTNPVVVSPGDVLGIYVHCAEENDDGVVYDNQHNKTTTFSDKFIHITSGMADLSSEPFSDRNPWGSFSSAWRPHREFVGRINYGVKYTLWNPNCHRQFPPSYRQFIRTMLLIDNRLKLFPKDVFLYMLNMCHWSWAGDLPEDVLRPDEEDEEDEEEDDDDDDDDSHGGNGGQYFIVEAARLFLMRQMLGDAFPFNIPEGTGPGDRVIIRMPGRRGGGGASSPPPNEVTYDILYDDGDSEERVPRDRIRTPSANASSSSSTNAFDEEDATPAVDNNSTELEVGTTVMVNWQNRGQYYPGRIHNVNQPQAQNDDGTDDTDDDDDGDDTGNADENENDDNSS